MSVPIPSTAMLVSQIFGLGGFRHSSSTTIFHHEHNAQHDLLVFVRRIDYAFFVSISYYYQVLPFCLNAWILQIIGHLEDEMFLAGFEGWFAQVRTGCATKGIA